MRLFTSRWANKELAELECQPVGISRGRPRFGTGYRYKLMRELAPSHEAFGIDDPQEFERAYRAGLEEIGLDTILGRMVAINREAGGLPLVFLCYEIDPADCHRGIASRWLREAGVEIAELQPGDLPQKPASPQPRLF